MRMPTTIMVILDSLDWLINFLRHFAGESNDLDVYFWLQTLISPC